MGVMFPPHLLGLPVTITPWRLILGTPSVRLNHPPSLNGPVCHDVGCDVCRSSAPRLGWLHSGLGCLALSLSTIVSVLVSVCPDEGCDGSDSILVAVGCTYRGDVRGWLPGYACLGDVRIQGSLHLLSCRLYAAGSFDGCFCRDLSADCFSTDLLLAGHLHSKNEAASEAFRACRCCASAVSSPVASHSHTPFDGLT